MIRTREKALAFRAKVVKAADNLPDSEAVGSMELFDPWAPNINAIKDKRYRHGDHLYRCQQSHRTQSDWTPDKTPALWAIVPEDGQSGTKDNPIDYSLNMELEEGKYYTEDGVLYLCIRALAQSVWHLADLVGNYVEVVTD